jgi:hypothetical protein
MVGMAVVDHLVDIVNYSLLSSQLALE